MNTGVLIYFHASSLCDFTKIIMYKFINYEWLYIPGHTVDTFSASR